MGGLHRGQLAQPVSPWLRRLIHTSDDAASLYERCVATQQLLQLPAWGSSHASTVLGQRSAACGCAQISGCAPSLVACRCMCACATGCCTSAPACTCNHNATLHLMGSMQSHAAESAESACSTSVSQPGSNGSSVSSTDLQCTSISEAQPCASNAAQAARIGKVKQQAGCKDSGQGSHRCYHACRSKCTCCASAHCLVCLPMLCLQPAHFLCGCSACSRSRGQCQHDTCHATQEAGRLHCAGHASLHPPCALLHGSSASCSKHGAKFAREPDQRHEDTSNAPNVPGEKSIVSLGHAGIITLKLRACVFACIWQASS